jgi:DNA-binding transcriptional LysR family regulator
MANPDARTLEVFRAVAAAGSVTRAADKLNTTQPNVTRAIGAFEKACGFALFDRTRYGMTLTPAGKQLLDVIERNLIGLRSVGQAIDELRGGGEPGVLRAIAVPFIADGPLATLLSDYARDRPRAALCIEIEGHEEVITAVELGRCDLAMIIGPKPKGTSLTLVPFGESRLAIAVPPNHRLANAVSVPFAELDGERFVQLMNPNHIRIATDALMANSGMRPGLTHEVATQRTVLELVRRGEMVGVADLAMIQDYAGQVVAVGLEPGVAWPVNLVYNGNRTHSRMLQDFLGWLESRPAG